MAQKDIYIILIFMNFNIYFEYFIKNCEEQPQKTINPNILLIICHFVTNNR